MQNKIVAFLICGVFLGACEGGAKTRNAQESSPPRLIPPHAMPAALPSSAPAVPRSELLQPASPSPGSTGLKKMGIEVEPGRIIIDTRRVQSYLDALGRQLERGLHQGVQKAEQNAPQEADTGIRVSSDSIEIDLNRTRHFIQEWIETMKIFGEELNRSLAPLP